MARELWDAVRALRVQVIGDAIRDIYTQARCLGAASKSPTLVYERQGSREWIGGAGVIAAHCHAAGATVGLTTAGETIKERILVSGVKVAEFHRAATPRQDRVELIAHPDCVLFADFGHGMFEPGSWPRMREALPASVLTAADTQTTDIAWGNILDFAGAHLLFANEREARFAVGDRWSPLEAVARRLWTRAHLAGTEALFLKRGPDGLSVYHQGPTLHVPACAVQPITDPIGAGDALLAYAAMTYAATKDLALAARLGSAAAAVACAQEGNAPVTPAAIRARWTEW